MISVGNALASRQVEAKGVNGARDSGCARGRGQFLNVAGSSTGSLLPTGQAVDNIDGIEVTCMDVAMPMVIARASDFGLVLGKRFGVSSGK